MQNVQDTSTCGFPPPPQFYYCLFVFHFLTFCSTHSYKGATVCVCTVIASQIIWIPFVLHVFSEKIEKRGVWCCSLLSGVVGSKLSSIAMVLAQFKLSLLSDCVTPKTWKLGSLQWFISNCFSPSCAVLMSEQESPHCSLVPWEPAACAGGCSLCRDLRSALSQLAGLILGFWTRVLTDGVSVYIESNAVDVLGIFFNGFKHCWWKIKLKTSYNV